MMKIADLLESKLEEFAEAESQDQGKPVWLAKTVDIPRAVHNFRFFSSAIMHFGNEYALLILKVMIHTVNLNLSY